MSIKKDKYYINLANNLAYNFIGYSGPNPSVGAVVVKNDEIISIGNTGLSGRPHAEINALKKLTINEKKNSTIYISLEVDTNFATSCVTLFNQSVYLTLLHS